MKQTKLLADRLREVLLDGKWVTGTNFKDQISNLDWKMACQKIFDLNTIADLTFHVHYYIAGVGKVLEGGLLEISDRYSFDAPPIKNEKDWKQLVDTFCMDCEKFIHLVESFSEQKLEQVFVDEKYGTYQRNIDVLIEHSYYHLGQVLLIKKLLKNQLG